jgi:hypothetical protein
VRADNAPKASERTEIIEPEPMAEIIEEVAEIVETAKEVEQIPDLDGLELPDKQYDDAYMQLLGIKEHD